MLSTRGQRIEELFSQALRISAEDRDAFLAQACGGDEQLRRELTSLLLADEQAAAFLETPAAAFAPEDRDLDLAETERSVGVYELLHEIGRGGMSTVWLAERADDQFRRQVAVKLIKRGMDSADVLRRFRAERQILAGLDHPNIACLYDGGTTESGRPYFVLEYIAGTAIDEDCARRGLGLAERLELFRTVCSAVAYAHRNLVIHRDIKPANILVTADGAPKLLDFGIARLLAPDPLQEAEATATLARLLTPQYASPEQLRGETLTTATDIYSLGVLLYKLLTGRLPYRLDGISPLAVERVLHAESPRPSTVREGPFSRLLEGDLDNIVLKAMHPEPARRYGSVELLAEDLRRYLAGLPVTAREDTLGYRLKKFLRRNRVPVAATAAATILILGFAVTAAVQSVRVTRERDQAQRERDQAEQVAQVLTGLFAAADPFGPAGSEPTVRQILDQESARVVRELEVQPRVQARLMDVLGVAYTSLRLFDRAEPMLTKALKIRRRETGPQSLEVAETLDHLGGLQEARGDTVHGEISVRRALFLERQLLSEDDLRVVETLDHLGELLFLKGDLAEAETLQRQVLAVRRRLLPAVHLDIASSLNGLAGIRFRQGHLREAELLIREAIVQRRRLLGDDHPLTADSVDMLAQCLMAQGEYKAAEPLLREVLAARRRRLGPRHPRVATSLANLGAMLLKSGDLASAEPLLREALALRRQVLGNDHPMVASSLYNLGALLRERGDFRAAERMFRESLAIERHHLAPGAWDIGIALTLLGDVICRQGDASQAEPLLREGLSIQRHALSAGPGRLTGSLGILGRCLLADHRYAEAEASFLESYAVLAKGEEVQRDQQKLQRRSLEDLVHLYEAWGKPQQATQYRQLLTGLPSPTPKPPTPAAR